MIVGLGRVVGGAESEYDKNALCEILKELIKNVSVHRHLW